MEGSEPIRVLVVDDHRVVREGLRSYLELVDDIEMVGEATDGRAALYWLVSNILSKLDLISRTQAALWAVSEGLGPPPA